MGNLKEKNKGRGEMMDELIDNDSISGDERLEDVKKRMSASKEALKEDIELRMAHALIESMENESNPLPTLTKLAFLVAFVRGLDFLKEVNMKYALQIATKKVEK